MRACQDLSIVQILEADGTCDIIVVDQTTYVAVNPESLQFTDEPVPQHEGVPFLVQPKIRGYDSAVSLHNRLRIYKI